MKKFFSLFIIFALIQSERFSCLPYGNAEEITRGSFNVFNQPVPPTAKTPAPAVAPKKVEVKPIDNKRLEAVEESLKELQKAIKSLTEQMKPKKIVGRAPQAKKTQLSYEESHLLASQQKKNVIIWVKYNSPLMEAKLKDYIHCHVDTFPPLTGSQIVLEVIDTQGKFTRYFFSKIPTVNEVITKTQKLPPPPVILENTDPFDVNNNHASRDTNASVPYKRQYILDDDKEYKYQNIYWRYYNEASKKLCIQENKNGKHWYLNPNRLYYWREAETTQQPTVYYEYQQPSYQYQYQYPIMNSYSSGSCGS